jgi:hypothetical protein
MLQFLFFGSYLFFGFDILRFLERKLKNNRKNQRIVLKTEE